MSFPDRGLSVRHSVSPKSRVGTRLALSEARNRMAAAWRRRRRLGESDCEEIRAGPIAQPVNALSSLAYVAGGSWVAARGVQAERPAAVTFGALLGGVGIGSVLYHGPCPPGARETHDSTLAAALALVVLHNAAAVTGRHRPVPRVVQAAAVVAAALPVVASGRFTNPVVAVLGLAGAATEAMVVRSHGTAGRSAAAALTLGAVINGLSRTGGPLCRPNSLLQGHAAWHLLSAAALAAWARGALLEPKA